MERILTVAILGVGSRGADTFGRKFASEPHKYKIVSLCEIRPARLERFQKEYGVDPSEAFLDEKDFLAKKRADILVIATQDRDHVRECIRALELGYDVILEKPITPLIEECYALLEAQKKYGHIVLVAHVLRYAPVYVKAAEIISSGALGQLVDINAHEYVGYWHQAHSFVRGNWRREDETSPMILAKCCHDMDLIQFYANSKAKTVSSVGELTFFNKSHQPEGASDRCGDCKFVKTCPYSAYRCYVEQWKTCGCPKTMWPQNVMCTDTELTEEGMVKAYENNNYGRCVFACDNDVVDHQETNILFENGVTANLCMTAFSAKSYRLYAFHCTMGELVIDEERREIISKPFGQKEEVFLFSDVIKNNIGHGGGDVAMVDNLYEMIVHGDKAATTLEESVESHLMALAAEKSRKNYGEMIRIHEDK